MQFLLGGCKFSTKQLMNIRDIFSGKFFLKYRLCLSDRQKFSLKSVQSAYKLTMIFYLLIIMDFIMLFSHIAQI